MKDKITSIIADIIVLLPIIVVLMIGFHCEATYVDTCKVISKTETTLECENIHTGVSYECSATETDSIKIGEKLRCKFTNECTESNPYDDHWIGFGKHSFLCFVW